MDALPAGAVPAPQVKRSSGGSSRSAGVLGFIGPLLVLVVIAFDVPVLLVLSYSTSSPAGFTFQNFEAMATTPVFMKVVLNTFRITAITTAVVAVLGYVISYWISGLTPRLRHVALALVALPFWVSVLVRTYAWIVVLGNGGLVNRLLQWSGLTDSPVAFLYNDLGVIIGMANIQMPLLVLPLCAAMMRVDQRHIQAAASLGAPGRVIFWRVFFPQTVPALLAGTLLVLIVCLGFYITPAILGGGRVPMVANMLEIYINQVPRWEMASAASVVLLAITLSLFAVYRRITRKAGS